MVTLMVKSFQATTFDMFFVLGVYGGEGWGKQASMQTHHFSKT
jgi:hypothetical protein